MMYDRVSARNGSVIIIDEGIKQEDNGDSSPCRYI